jgi:hypothetical protein
MTTGEIIVGAVVYVSLMLGAVVTLWWWLE